MTNSISYDNNCYTKNVSFIIRNIQGSLNKFPDFFIWALLLLVHTWNSSPLPSNLLQLQCTCTIPTTSGRPHGCSLVWACQWPPSLPLSSPQLSHNFLTLSTPLIIPYRLLAFLESLMPLKNWCSIHARWSKSSLKPSICFCGILSKFKTEFYCISFFLTSRLNFWNSPAVRIRL